MKNGNKPIRIDIHAKSPIRCELNLVVLNEIKETNEERQSYEIDIGKSKKKQMSKQN